MTTSLINLASAPFQLIAMRTVTPGRQALCEACVRRIRRCRREVVTVERVPSHPVDSIRPGIARVGGLRCCACQLCRSTSGTAANRVQACDSVPVGIR